MVIRQGVGKVFQDDLSSGDTPEPPSQLSHGEYLCENGQVASDAGRGPLTLREEAPSLLAVFVVPMTTTRSGLNEGAKGRVQVTMLTPPRRSMR